MPWTASTPPPGGELPTTSRPPADKDTHHALTPSRRPATPPNKKKTSRLQGTRTGNPSMAQPDPQQTPSQTPPPFFFSPPQLVRLPRGPDTHHNPICPDPADASTPKPYHNYTPPQLVESPPRDKTPHPKKCPDPSRRPVPGLPQKKTSRLQGQDTHHARPPADASTPTPGLHN
ncbi:uncharacterized protein LOC135196695 [Macrobrachium nipponense]|uniref:uncharacterized protein LOC135196695 n=1 Tax=Macrobrachium nipponense TaxID=159736 RepID=UPI0030C80078